MDILRVGIVALLATWGLAAVAVTAGADGPPHRPPVYDATPGFYDFNWGGYYVGAHLGAGFIEAESAESVVVDPALMIFDTGTFGQSAWSFAGGVQAGWQRQWEKIVAGVEVTYTAARLDQTSLSPIIPDIVRSSELHDLITLTGRLGYADGRWLAYAKGGWASAEIDVVYRDNAGAVTAATSGRESGWTAGVGIDYALTHTLFLGVEYNYLHFQADVSPPTIPGTTINDVIVDVQTFVVRLNYRFGGPACAGVPPGCR
jgi:outer membrane immunogenic protein